MSSIIRYDRPVHSLTNLFDEFFNDSYNSLESSSRQAGSVWPTVDITENDHGYTIQADIPGLDKNDIKINVEKETLTISGEKKAEKKESKKGTFSYYERSYGSFSRSFKLPDYVDKNSIAASYKNGVLEISIKKSEAALPRQISIKVD